MASEPQKSLNRANVLSDEHELEKEEISSILRKKNKSIATKPKINAYGDLAVSSDDEDGSRLSSLRRIKSPSKSDGVVFAEEKSLIDQISHWDIVTKNRSFIHQVQSGLEEKGDKFDHFKYGLPIPNIDPEFKGVTEITDILKNVPPTSVENLYEVLDMDGDTSYSQMISLVKERYNYCKLCLIGIQETTIHQK